MSAPHIHDTVAAFHFPPYRVFQLAGGVKVFVVHDQTQELISLSVIAKAGSTQETREGEAAFAAAMLSRGSLKRNTTQFAEDVDALGAALRSMGHRDTTGVAATGLAQHASTLVELLAECVLEPAFDPEEFERLRFQTVSDHEYSLSDPQFLAHRAFSKTMFGDHPYATSRSGTLGSLSEMSAAQCSQFYSDLRANAPWFIVVAGNFENEQIDKDLRRHFDALISRSSQTAIIPVEPIRSTRCGFAAYENARQVVLSVGQLTVGRTNKAYPAIQLLTTMFGGYFLSRLNSIIREEKGFSYGVHASLDSMVHASRMSASCSVSPENLAETIDILRQQWKRLASEKISEAELRQCKRFILGSFARSMETPQQVAQFLGTAEEAGLEPQYYEEFVQRIAALSVDELFAVQQEFILPDALVIAAAGRKADVQPVLEKVADTQELLIE